MGARVLAALFDSGSAEEVYNRLADLKPDVEDYWSGRDADRDINSYVLGYESLPYVLNIKSVKKSPAEDFKKIAVIRSSIRQTLERVYNHDVSLIGQLDQSTRQYFPSLLLWLANSDRQSLTKTSQRLSLNIRTLQKMLEILVSSKILMAVPTFGSTSGKIAKPYKYLFSTPAIRQALNNLASEHLIGRQFDKLRGSLLEDTHWSLFKTGFLQSTAGWPD